MKQLFTQIGFAIAFLAMLVVVADKVFLHGFIDAILAAI